MKLCSVLLSLFAVVAPSLAQQPGKPVSLGRNQPLRSGTELRESLRLGVEGGETRIEAKSTTRQLSTRWIHRYTLVRRIQGGGSEEVEVRDHVCETGNFPAGAMPPPAETFGPLANKTLKVRKRAVGSEFVFKEGKPKPAETSCLADLGFLSGLLELLPAAIGTQLRKVGETWTTKVQNPRGKAYGLPVLKDLEATLGSVEERDGDSYAHVLVSGSFAMQRPLGYNATIEVTFAAQLTRRLSDMLDVEMKVTGRFKNSYPSMASFVENAPAEPATFVQDFPYTLTRTLKLEPK